MTKEHFDNKFIDDIDETVGDNYFSPVLDYVFDHIEANDVCDIGCGNGIFSGDLKQRTNCNLIGVDSNKYALEQAQKLDFDMLIQVKDFTKDKLPIDSSSTDFVICKDVLEHLIDPLFLTNEISRILKTNGYLLVHVPNHFPIWARLKFLLSNDIDTFNYFPGSNRYDFPHIRFFTLSSMKKLLTISGFEIIENRDFNDIGVGIASKDGSSVTVSDTIISDYKLYAAMSYLKKDFYDMPSISLNNCLVSDENAYIRQKGTSMLIDGIEIPESNLSVEKLYKTKVMSK